MSNNFDKIVKLACKPKNAPPKAKYVDSLVAATYSDDGSLNDITRSLALRLREPNAVVVFKALLTLHQMIRSGSTDQLLEHLAQSDTLRLRNVSGQNWEGYSASSNMGHYADYLDSRIRAWREVKHDVVSVQTESNRRSTGLGAGSKARRLRHLPVEKGLLREVKQVQNILDSLIKCKLYDDDLKEENTVLAFRMLVKDLLVSFQAGNEGVCNILEHYFEMSKSDARDSFDIYKSFIKQTDRVVDYLGVARKLHNIVNVPVPNLKHAPTGLVKALEEYLNDPNFEQNRIEYKRSLGVVEGSTSERPPSPGALAAQEADKPPPSSSSAPASAPTAAPASTAPPGASQKIQDFFDSIQADQQPTMFGGPAQGFPQQMHQPFGQQQFFGQQESFGQQQQQQPFNPFRQSTMMPQQTGFLQPQMTAFPVSHAQPFQPQQTGAMPFAQQTQQAMFQPQPQPFIQPQSTGFLGGQSPQSDANPFRQSTMVNTSFAHGAMSQPSSPFSNHANQPSANTFAAQGNQIQRPGSTPAVGETKPQFVQPPTKNPFAPAQGMVQQKPAEPRGPSMNDLSFGSLHQQDGGFAQQQPQQQQQITGLGQQNPAFLNSSSSPWGSANVKTSESNGSGMSDIASAFTQPTASNKNQDFLSQFGSISGNGTGTGSTSPSSQFNSLPSERTGASSPSKAFLQPQATGYGGSTVKRFQPSSSFGSQLLDSLPRISEPGSASSPGSGDGVQPQQTGFPGMNAFGNGHGLGHEQGQHGGQTFGQGQQGGQGGQPGAYGPAGQGGSGGQFGQSGQGMQVQSTGVANPFRGSTGFGQGAESGPAGSAGGMGGAGAFGSSSPFAGLNRPQQAQGGMGPFGGQAQGQGGPFGQQQTGAGAGAFGQQPNGAGAFGQQGGAGAFGQQGGQGPFGGMFGQMQTGQRQEHNLI